MIEKEGIVLQSIFQHYKGDFYRVKDVAYDRDTGEPWVVYNKCDENGIYKTIRPNIGTENEIIVNQPFLCRLSIWTMCVQGGYPGNPAIPRFKFIK